MPGVRCQMSKISLLEKSDGASHWSVCYQRGLPRLVFSLVSLQARTPRDALVVSWLVNIFTDMNKGTFLHAWHQEGKKESSLQLTWFRNGETCVLNHPLLKTAAGKNWRHSLLAAAILALGSVLPTAAVLAQPGPISLHFLPSTKRKKIMENRTPSFFSWGILT